MSQVQILSLIFPACYVVTKTTDAMRPHEFTAYWRLSVAEHGRRIDHGAVLLVEVGERHRMYFISSAQPAVEITASEREARIRD